MKGEISELALEANWLHQFFFRTQAPAELVHQYVRAEQFYNRSGKSRGVSLDVPHLIRAGVDLEALEFFLRLSRRTNDLTRKFATCCMLSEVKSAYLDRFILLTDMGALLALLSLVVSGFRAVFKLWRGALEARKLGLV